jgi:hypothetical protein
MMALWGRNNCCHLLTSINTFVFDTPTHHNPFVRSIGDYTLPDLLHQYKKYLHKRPKHILLWSDTLLLQCIFLFCHFFTAVPSITWRGSTVTPSHSECSAGKLVDKEQFCTVRHWSVCIYILQINFYKYIYIYIYIYIWYQHNGMDSNFYTCTPHSLCACESVYLIKGISTTQCVRIQLLGHTDNKSSRIRS